jgi:hypothetical protein
MGLEACLSYIAYARQELLEQFEGLTEEVLNTVPVNVKGLDGPNPQTEKVPDGNHGWPVWPLWNDLRAVLPLKGVTAKDILAHIAAWEKRMVEILPLMLADRASDIPAVDIEEFNRHAVEVRQASSMSSILAELEKDRSQLIELITAAGDVALAKRRSRRGRTFTIESYLTDVMAEHDRVHAAQLKRWRQANDF